MIRSDLPQTLLVTLVTLVSAAPLLAQQRTVSGIVEDPSGGAIAGAVVAVTCGDQSLRTTTDASGGFSLGGLPPAVCSVEATSDLFSRRVIRVDLSSRSSAFLRLVLSVAGIETEIVVTPARGEQERTFDVPEPVSVSTREEIESRPVTILPQALREETGVLVQQTTTAQGSAFIRGLSAQRVVYLLDGIRFNTSTFRAGATQYLGWINPSIVQRLEVVRGPASVQYGSDALGGTVNVLSLQPAFSPAGATAHGHVEISGGTADLSAGGDAQLRVAYPGFALTAGGAARRVNDLRTGRSDDSHSALTRFLGLPSDIEYTRLPETSFTQTGGYVAVSARDLAAGTVTGVYLHESQAGVNRYDRIIGGDGLHRSEFDPQQLDFAYARYDRGATGRLASLRAAFSVNRQEDDRLEQARPSSEVERERSRVTALGYQGQASALLGRHALTFGAEVYDEFIGGRRTIESPLGTSEDARPEIPDDTRYTSTGLFLQEATDLAGGRLGLRAGVRYGYFSFRTRPDPALGVEHEHVVTDAWTFNAGGVWKLTPVVNATFSVSRGFRAANAFDLGAIGISGGGFEISPTTAVALDAGIGTSDGADAVATGQAVGALEPESLYAFEGGLKFRTDRLGGAVNVFDMELVDIIQRRTGIFDTSVVGTVVAGYPIVSVDEAGRAYVPVDPRPIVTRVNVDRARIVGIEADAQVRLTTDWIATAYFATARGHELEAGNYLRRMPPPIGGVRLKWEPSTRGYWLEGVLTFALDQTRLSPGDLGDARIGARRSRGTIADFFNGTATDMGLVQNGMLVATGETLPEVQARVLGDEAAAPLFTKTPGFVVLGARAGWTLGPRIDLALLADNLTDRNYRWHGSGVDAPGISLWVKTRVRF